MYSVFRYFNAPTAKLKKEMMLKFQIKKIWLIVYEQVKTFTGYYIAF